MSLPNQTLRLDPAPSKVFTFLEWRPDSPAVVDDHGQVIQPAGPSLHVRYRYNGAEWIFYPVSESEAREVMNPGARYGFSIGSAFGQIVKAQKSGRMVRAGESRTAGQEAKRQDQGRRWLA